MMDGKRFGCGLYARVVCAVHAGRMRTFGEKNACFAVFGKDDAA